MASSTVGGSTSTGWKRRSSAASFSMCLRYSSSVVAPMQCSSPRASMGLSMLPASMAPSALPAPTMVCSSSMNSRMRPLLCLISCSTAFRRSSNSPRYLAPASSAPMSSAKMVLSFSPSGTSPRRMRWARPSTMAVLPTPGLADEHGVVLGLAGEDADGAADLVVAADHRVELALPGLLRPGRCRISPAPGRCASGLSDVTRWLPRISRRAFSTFARSRPKLLKIFFSASGLATSTRPRNRCSVLTYSSLSFAGLLLGPGEHLVDGLGHVDLGHVDAAGHLGQAVQLALDARAAGRSRSGRASRPAPARCRPPAPSSAASRCQVSTSLCGTAAGLVLRLGDGLARHDGESVGIHGFIPRITRAKPLQSEISRAGVPAAGHVGCRRDAPALVRPATAPAMEAPSLSPNLPHNRLRRAAAMKSPRATRLSRKVITSPMHTLFLSIAPTVG